MTINVKGVDGSNFAFPDGTPEDVITSAIDDHYGGPAAGADAAPDIGENRASTVAMLRGIPIGGAGVDKATAMLNAALQPITETGLSHAPNYADRVAENQLRIKAATDAYEAAHPIGTTATKLAAGTAALAPLGASAAAAKVLGMTGSLPSMVGYGMGSGAAIGGVDAAARGEDPLRGAVESGIAGGALPVVGRGIGKAVRGIRNLVSSTPRTPNTVDLNGVKIPVPESYTNPDNAVGTQEQLASTGALGPEPQKVAQAATEATHGATQEAANQFGDEMRGGPGPSQPAATAHPAADQNITELAQQHNDQIAAQARHDAQIAAEGTGIRSNVATPLGTPEPALPVTANEAVGNVQGALQGQQRASAANRTSLYNDAGQIPGSYHPAAFTNIGTSIRNRIDRATAGNRPVTVNQQLTPHADAMLGMLDNRLGNNYYDNALRRGDMVRTPDGRVVPRPLTPADVESARQEMVSHLRDANSAARAPGGSGTDAYAAQRIMDAFNQHHNAVLQTPGAFTGDGPAYRQAIEAARAAHSQHRQTFSNQGNGDTVGPVIERMIGRHQDQQMPVGQMATSMFGPANNPGGGNSHAISARVMQILGDNPAGRQTMQQGMLSHILDTPEGADALSASKQSARLHQYLSTPHAQQLFAPEEIARLRAHANDLLVQARPAPTPTPVQRQIEKLGSGTATSSDLVRQVFPATGKIGADAEHLLTEVKARVSQPAFNSIRQAMWSHLISKPEGMVDWGPRALSNRLSAFLASPASRVLYSDQELGVMRQFQQHYDKMAPLPNTTNPSGSATMAAKMVRSAGNHILGLLGMTMGGPFGHLGGLAAGEAIQRGAQAVKTAKQVADTKDLFLGQKPKGALNRNYERAAGVLSHAATPLVNSGP